MSKVFKSTFVQMGTPKPLEHVFIRPEKPKVHEEVIENVHIEEVPEDDSQEERANEIIEEAKQMYLKIIEEANLEAKKIKDNAYEESAAIRENERAAGFEEGFAEGRGQAQQIIDEAMDIRTYLDSRKEEIPREIEEQVIGLILDISKKIIGDELRQNPEIVFTLIKEALSRCAFKNKLAIRVSQDDYEYVMERKNRISAMIEGISELEIYQDLSLGAGGCVIETSSGEINSSIDVQLRELEKSFMYVLRNE